MPWVTSKSGGSQCAVVDAVVDAANAPWWTWMLSGSGASTICVRPCLVHASMILVFGKETNEREALKK